jgi:hypothetical protein
MAAAEMNHKTNTDVMKETNTESNMNFIENYRAKWKRHSLRMPRWRLPFQMLRYEPKGKRSTGRPFKRWNENVTGH